MSELIADLPYRVVDTHGHEFYVSVAGALRADGEWEGWLEYVPLDDSDPSVTPTETTQPSRAALEHWAPGLSDTYIQGAFQRAVSAVTGVPRVAAMRRVASSAYAVTPTSELPDPFEWFDQGPEALRNRLSTLPRTSLLDVIAAYGLNPAGKSLAWLTDRQLITFIVTAVDAQRLAGRRSA